jgi:hypothetical protein
MNMTRNYAVAVIASPILSSPGGFYNFGGLSLLFFQIEDSFDVGFSLAYSPDLPAVLRDTQFALLPLLDE